MSLSSFLSFIMKQHEYEGEQIQKILQFRQKREMSKETKEKKESQGDVMAKEMVQEMITTMSSSMLIMSPQKETKKMKSMSTFAWGVSQHGQLGMNPYSESCVVNMIESVINFKEMTNCKIEDALYAATYTPAQVLNILNRKGQLNFGCDADFVILDQNNFSVLQTYIDGKLEYDHNLACTQKGN